MNLPSFKYSVICEPEVGYGDGFYRIYIRDGEEKNVVKIIRIEDLKNQSFNDHMWYNLRKEFEKLIEREGDALTRP